MGRSSGRNLAVLLLVALSACGGDSSSPLPPPSSPAPPPTPPPTAVNPCAAAAAQADEATAFDEDRARASAQRALDAGKGPGGLGSDERPVFDLLWNHALRRQPLAADADIGPARPAVTADVGHIAVIEDDGTLLLRQNAFDLRQRGLRFERNGNGGYDIVETDAAFRQTLGRRLMLTDDDAAEERLPFAVPFYGQSFSSVFVNSDGNLTFEVSDTASSTRGFARLLGGPPRIAPFFSDLDPTTGGGRLFVQSAADDFTVTWCGVRGFEETRSVTVQVSLFASGVIEMRYGAEIDLPDAIIAVSPGRTGNFTPVDLSGSGRRAGGAAAVGERFAQEAELDLVAVARRFYATHRDDFDQLVVWSDTAVVSDAFAFESTVSNAIRGIGQDVFDSSRDFGSGGALGSMLVMDRLAKYPDNPAQVVLGELSALAVLAHETAHRWLVRLLFRGDNGSPSDDLLGRQRAHWSFFVDSDASVMEGNDIEDLRGGAFRTAGAGQRYSRADLYAMGLASVAEVPPFFYVDAPVNVSPARDRESAPRTGVTFNGTRRDVLIQDIVDALGPRQPSSAESPRLHRQAYLYVVGRGVTASSADVAKLDRIRREFEGFFRQATEGRMTVRTTLN